MHSPPAGASVSLSQRSRATRFGGSVTKTKKKQKRGKGTERSAAARRTLIPLRSGRQCETLSSLTQFHPPRKHARMCRFYCRLVNITRIRRRTARAPHSDERAAEQTFPAGPSLYADLFFLVRPTARSVVRTRIYSCVGGGPVHSPGHQTWTPLYPPHEACMRRGCLLLRNISRGMTYTQGAVMAIPFWPALREVTEGGRREKRFGLLPRRGSS